MPDSNLTVPPACAGPMPDGKLTRAEVARRLGVSRTTLRRLDGKSLHPIEGPGGVRFFEEREVEAFQITYRGTRSSVSRGDHDEAAGERAAEAFERFDQGASPIEVVKALRLRPDHVMALHDEWVRMHHAPKPPALKSEGEIAARAYEMFAAGKSCREVAIELREPARVVLQLHGDFAALNEADAVDLPVDVIATFQTMGYRLPKRYPARAIPGLLNDIIESLMARIEELDPEAIEARKALAEWTAASAKKDATSTGGGSPQTLLWPKQTT